MGTMEPLQSNILIRRETDTPVHYRVTETEVTEREKKKEWLVEGMKKIAIEEVGCSGKCKEKKTGMLSNRGVVRDHLLSENCY